MKLRTVDLVAYVLLHADKPMSVRQIATAIGRPLRSVHNVILRLRRAGMVEVAEVVKPIGSRHVALYRWAKDQT